MKRITLLIALLLCLMASNAFAQAITSGVTTGAATATKLSVVYGGPALVTGVNVICSTTTDTDLYVLDSGVTKIMVRAEGTTMPSYRYDFQRPIMFDTDIEIKIVGTGGKAIIEYIPR